jgi:hypothetical protein
MEILKDPKKKNKAKKKDSGFMSKLWSVFLIFLTIIALYSLLSGSSDNPKIITLSELSADIKEGTVKSILVEGERLSITMNDEAGTVVESKKELESSLTDTLANYGVTPELLAKTNIEVKNESATYKLPPALRTAPQSAADDDVVFPFPSSPKIQDLIFI